MHLAIVSPYPPNITGISQYGYHVSQSLAESGQFSRITILADTPRVPRQIPTHALIQIENAWQPNQLNAGWKIVTSLQNLKPDIIWFNLDVSAFGRSPLANLSGFLSPIGAHRLGFPTVVTLHELVELADLRTLKAPTGPLAPYGAHLLTYIATQADVVCLTMRRYMDWLSAQQPHLQCMHIPIGAYHQPEILPESESPEILLFGMLAPYKGLEILLEAFSSLRGKNHPNLRLTIAGTAHPRFPGYARQLQQAVRGTSGIRWLGEVPEEQVRELFLRAQVVALPYTASVGSSSVLYQAATWGRPVVASDLPETQAMVRESNLDVTFFQRGDADNLARKIAVLLDSPDLRRQQAVHNLAAIQRNGPEETCRAYLQAFNLALESRLSPKRIIIPARVPSESV